MAASVLEMVTFKELQNCQKLLIKTPPKFIGTQTELQEIPIIVPNWSNIKFKSVLSFLVWLLLLVSRRTRAILNAVSCLMNMHSNYRSATKNIKFQVVHN